MSGIEKIVADYETSKKAWDIGLRLWNYEGKFLTVFAWWRCLHDYETEIVAQSDWDSEAKIFYHKMYPAPTAEEIPLPISVGIGEWPISWTRYQLHWGNHSFDRGDDNEATARLKMAIWLIENVPEAKQWYVNNGYLKSDI